MTKTAPHGYSGTPLAKKLGFKPGMHICVLNPPPEYMLLLEPLPNDIHFSRKPTGNTELIHLFTESQSVLKQKLNAFVALIRPDAIIWISWPKKSSKVPTDVTEDTIREAALPLGLVDVKVCAIDAVWSGLKLVIRRELRQVHK